MLFVVVNNITITEKIVKIVKYLIFLKKNLVSNTI